MRIHTIGATAAAAVLTLGLAGCSQAEDMANQAKDKAADAAAGAKDKAGKAAEDAASKAKDKAKEATGQGKGSEKGAKGSGKGSEKGGAAAKGAKGSEKGAAKGAKGSKKGGSGAAGGASGSGVSADLGEFSKDADAKSVVAFYEARNEARASGDTAGLKEAAAAPLLDKATSFAKKHSGETKAFQVKVVDSKSGAVNVCVGADGTRARTITVKDGLATENAKGDHTC